MKQYFLLFFVLSLFSWFAADGFAAEGSDLRVMTFNVRFGTAHDGVNDWQNRRDMLANRIRNADPDLLGLQEALEFQNEFLRGQLPAYVSIGVGRDDGDKKGEFATLFVRKDRFQVVSSGTFWLSTTPEIAGSVGWDAAKTRIVSWARLRDHTHADQELLWLNTHFDHRGTMARLESAHLLRKFIEQQGAGLAVIVTGDFNEVPGSPTYQALLEKKSNPEGVTLQDAYTIDPARQPGDDSGTVHGYRLPTPDAPAPPMKRIDWILNSPAFSVRSVIIDRYHEGAVFPSDHFPVIASFGWE